MKMMKVAAVLFVISMIVFVAGNAFAGQLKPVEVGDSFELADDNHGILMGDKQVYLDRESFALNIKREFTNGSEKMALLEINSGGTACPATYRMITVRKIGSPLISGEFGNCSDQPEINVKGDTIQFRFPGKTAESWVYQAGHVTRETFAAFWKKFKTAVAENDQTAVARMTRMPFQFASEDLTAAKFIKKYDRIIDRKAKSCLATAKAQNDYQSHLKSLPDIRKNYPHLANQEYKDTGTYSVFCDGTSYLFGIDGGEYKLFELGVND